MTNALTLVLQDLRDVLRAAEGGVTIVVAVENLKLSGLRESNLTIALTNGIPREAPSAARDWRVYDTMADGSRRIRVTWVRRTIKNRSAALRYGRDIARCS